MSHLKTTTAPPHPQYLAQLAERDEVEQLAELALAWAEIDRLRAALAADGLVTPTRRAEMTRLIDDRAARLPPRKR